MKVTRAWTLLSLPAVLGMALGAALAQTPPQPAPPTGDWSNFGQPAQPAPATPPATPTYSPPPPVTTPEQTPPPTSPYGQLPPSVNLPPAPPPVAAPPPVVPGPAAAEGTVTETPLPSPTPATSDASIGDRAAERLTSSSMGPVGLYHLESADVGALNELRLGLYGQYFRDSNFPVLDANDERSVGILTLAYTPLKFLEVYGGTQIDSNVSSGTHGTSPAFVGELGDFWLGIKAGGFVTGGLAIGGDLRGYGYSGVGTSGVGAGAFGPAFLVTYDALQTSRFPLRLHLNLGGFFGNLNNLTTTNAAGQAVTLRAPEQFALGYTPWNQFRMNVGLELPLPDVTPFVEYEMLAPITSGALLGPDQSPVSYGQALPDDIAFGLRVTALRDISFLAAVDVAFQERVALGVPILPPWEAYLGLSYNWDPVVRGSVKTIEKIKTVAAPAPPPVEEKGQIGGTVVDADTSKPIGGAFVTVDGMDLPPVATTPSEGRFQTYELREGPVNVTVTKDGYAAGSAHAMVEKGKTVQVSVTLKSEVHPIALHLKIRSSKGKATEASVSIHGPKEFKQDVNVPDSGEADATLPNPGAYTLEVSASGFMAKGAAVTAVANQPATAEVELSPKPKKSGVSVSATKIQLKKQLHFATDGSEIQSDSFAVLDEVVDAIIQGHLKVKVAAHTDNQGSKEHNLALSQERADAVKAYLEKAGVPADHLEAVGYGDTKPIAPNFTNRGRALNRRTEFEIQ